MSSRRSRPGYRDLFCHALHKFGPSCAGRTPSVPSVGAFTLPLVVFPQCRVPNLDRAVLLSCKDLTAEMGQAQSHSRGSVVTRLSSIASLSSLVSMFFSVTLPSSLGTPWSKCHLLSPCAPHFILSENMWPLPPEKQDIDWSKVPCSFKVFLLISTLITSTNNISFWLEALDYLYHGK